MGQASPVSDLRIHADQEEIIKVSVIRVGAAACCLQPINQLNRGCMLLLCLQLYKVQSNELQVLADRDNLLDAVVFKVASKSVE